MKLWRRQLFQEPALVMTVLVAVFLAAAFVAAMPRVLEHASQQDLEQAIIDATPEQRNIALELRTRLGAGSNRDPFNYVQRQGVLRRQAVLPASVDRLVGEQHFLFESPRFDVSSFPDQVEGPFPTTFRFRYQEGIEDELRLAEGTMPGIRDPILMFRGTACPSEALASPEYEVDDAIDCVVDKVPVFETAVTLQTAKDMDVGVGDSVILTPSLGDVQWHQGAPPPEVRLVLVVAGIVELSDPDREYWYADNALHGARITENSDFRLVDASGLLRPDRYRQFLRHVPSVGNDYTWRYLVAFDRVVAEEADTLAVDLAKLAGSDAQVRTRLPELLREFVEQREVTESLLVIVTTSLAGVVLALVAVVALLLSARQSWSNELLVGRGASRVRQVGTSCLTCFVLVAPAAACGWFIAWGLLPETKALPSVVAVLWFCGAVFVCVVLAFGPLRFFPSQSRQRSSLRVRRVVVELSVVAAALAATLLVRRRASAMTQPDLFERSDPLVVLVPILVLASVCVAVARLLGPALRAAARVIAQRRGIVGFVSLRRASQPSWSLRAPVLTVIVAVAVAVFAATTSSSINEAQEQHATYLVGSDFRIDARLDEVPLPPSVQRSILGPEATWAFGTTLSQAAVIGESGGAVADLTLIEAASYGHIMEMSGRDAGAIASLSTMTSGTHLPAIVSRSWPGSVQPGLGDDLSIKVGGVEVLVTVIAVGHELIGVSPPQPAVLIDLDRASHVLNERQLEPRVAYINAPPGAGLSLERLAAAEQGSVRVLSRQGVIDDIAGDPFSTWLDRVLAIVLATALVASLVAVVAGAAMSASARRRDMTMLRTLGVAPPQSAAIGVLEQIPSIALAILVGLGSGGAIAYLLTDALGLGAFAGGSASVSIAISFSRPALVATGSLALAIVGIVLAELRHARSSDAKLLRVGDR